MGVCEIQKRLVKPFLFAPFVPRMHHLPRHGLREVPKQKSGLTPMRLQRRGASMLEAARAYGLPHHATRPDHSGGSRHAPRSQPPQHPSVKMYTCSDTEAIYDPLEK
jgi:hypothetical protein